MVMSASSRKLQLSPSMEYVLSLMAQGWQLTEWTEGDFSFRRTRRGTGWPESVRRPRRATILALIGRGLVEWASLTNSPATPWRLTKKGREAATAIINHSTEAASDEDPSEGLRSA